MPTRHDVAVEAAAAGASVAMRHFDDDPDVSVRTKETETDYVTEADTNAQEAVVDVIRETYPDDVVVGEEGDGPKTVPEEGSAWIIDPIDGTTNFIYGLKVWGSAVAAVEDGSPVAAAVSLPALDERFEADGETARRDGTPVSVSDRSDPDEFLVAPTLRYATGPDARRRFADLTSVLAENVGDTRRLGCAQATLAYVASGSLDATVGPFPPYSWDTVAGAHMVDLAGGTVTDLQGNPWRHDSDAIVASNGAAHDELVSLVADELE